MERENGGVNMGGRGAIAGAGGNSSKSKLPQLEGSEKQIKWAEDIRKEILKEVDNLGRELRADKEIWHDLHYTPKRNI